MNRVPRERRKKKQKKQHSYIEREWFETDYLDGVFHSETLRRFLQPNPSLQLISFESSLRQRQSLCVTYSREFLPPRKKTKMKCASRRPTEKFDGPIVLTSVMNPLIL